MLKELRFLQLFLVSDFNKVRANQRRVELRFLHAELAHYLRTLIAVPSIKTGTYDTFRGAEKHFKSTFADPVSFVQHLQVAINLDTALEHNDFPISNIFWEKAVSEIISFADFLTRTRILSLEHLSQLGSSLIANKKNAPLPENGFITELWVKCHFLRDIANQRQALVNLMINIAGDHLRSKAKEQIFPLPLEFQMGDKEAFQAIPNSGLMPSYKNSYYLTELRGRRRHHVESEFTSEQVKNELMVLHEYGSLANDEELAWIFLNAWYIYN